MTITIRWRDGRSMTARTASELLNKMIESNPVNPTALPDGNDRAQYRQDVIDRIFTLYGFELDADENDTDSEFFEALHRSGVATVTVNGECNNMKYGELIGGGHCFICERYARQLRYAGAGAFCRECWEEFGEDENEEPI